MDEFSQIPAKTRNECYLAVTFATLFFIVLSIQQVGDIAQLFGGGLKRFDLLAQLRLLRLLLTENLVDISHGNCLLSAIYVLIGTSSTQGMGFELRA